jgi:hypothetical protein
MCPILHRLRATRSGAKKNASNRIGYLENEEIMEVGTITPRILVFLSLLFSGSVCSASLLSIYFYSIVFFDFV